MIRKTVAECCASSKTIECNSIIVDGSLDYLICDHPLIYLGYVNFDDVVTVTACGD